MNHPSLDTLLDFATDAAWQAGRITLGYFQTDMERELKADNSPVTIADRQAEERLRELIMGRWPDHGIVGEEYEQHNAGAQLTWYLDPIDGTRSFIHGVPLYSVLVALMDGEEPLVGVAHFPGLNETICARRGGGCFWNGRRARVSGVRNLSVASVMVSNFHNFDKHGHGEAWAGLVKSTGLKRTWGDGYGHALVATGRADIMIDPVMNSWDCGPFQIILEEAGGSFTDLKGKPTIFGGNALATNGHLLDEVVRIFGQGEKRS